MSPDLSHVGILRGGAHVWNAWREKNPNAIPKLTGIALGVSERQLGPAHGGPINLRTALLQNAELRFATLTTADLSAADLSGADLAHARLNKANLSSANLDKSRLDYARLDDANLSGLSLRSASLRFTSLSSANLEDANLAGANLTHARLNRTNLRATNLSGSRLDYADFAGADLSGANLRGANLQNVRNLTPSQLEESLGDLKTVLPPHLQGTVSWSPRSAAPVAIVPIAATNSVRRDLAPSGHARGTIWAAAALALSLVTLTAGWWWHGLDHRSPVSGIEVAPEKLNTAKRPISNAQTIDRPDIVVRPLNSQAAVVHQSEAFKDRAVVNKVFSPVIVRTLPGTDDVRLATVTNLQLERLAPSSLTTRQLPLVMETARLRQQYSALVELSAAPPTLSTLKPPIPPPLLKSSTAPITSLQARPPELVALMGDLPSSEISLLPARIVARMRDANVEVPPIFAHSTPVVLSVSLKDQTIDVYGGTHLVASSKVSSGMPGHETKAGVFSILEKQRFHHSNIYSGAPMPWMLRLTRSGTALHAGVVPGYPASHGCIRLPFSFALKLFQD